MSKTGTIRDGQAGLPTGASGIRPLSGHLASARMSLGAAVATQGPRPGEVPPRGGLRTDGEALIVRTDQLVAVCGLARLFP